MLRLTLFLSAAIYTTMTVFGTDPDAPPRDGVEVSQAGIGFGAGEVFSGIAALARYVAQPAEAKPTRVTVPVVLPPIVDTSEALLKVTAADAPRGWTNRNTAAAPVDAEGLDLVYVTGSVVNLRAGPSTRNEVIGQMRRATPAALIGRAGNGWLHIRDLGTGREGYMAAKFLSASEPANG